MKATNKSLRKEQARYKRNFDVRLRKQKYEIPVGSYVFLRKEQGTATEPKHKLAQVATGPYLVKKSDQHTVVIAIGDQEERVSRDRVELAPSPMDYVPVTGLRQALQFLSETNGDGQGNVSDDEDGPSARASTPVDSNSLISNSQSVEVPQNTQEAGSLEAQVESEDLQKGEDNNPVQEEVSEDTEYVIDKVVDHAYQDEKLILKVKWYGYGIEDATWEPVEQLPRSAVVTYFRRKKLSLPQKLVHAQAG